MDLLGHGKFELGNSRYGIVDVKGSILAKNGFTSCDFKAIGRIGISGGMVVDKTVNLTGKVQADKVEAAILRVVGQITSAFITAKEIFLSIRGDEASEVKEIVGERVVIANDPEKARQSHIQDLCHIGQISATSVELTDIKVDNIICDNLTLHGKCVVHKATCKTLASDDSSVVDEKVQKADATSD
ncbi:hypothetical protein AGMMS50276_32570 [Synergistales bacterium]|nr:hypothetical protein AGMMS50276_32570 [Synergistales bacterium]